MLSLKTMIYVGIIILLTVISSVTFADDGAFEGEGANVYPISNNDVQMVSETINISYIPGEYNNPNNIRSSYWEVDVTMHFLNHGPPATIQMGFPFKEPYSPDYRPDDDENTDSSEEEPAYAFKSYVNGKSVKTITKKGVLNPELPERYNFEKVMTFSVHFNAGEKKVIRHTYNVGGESYSDGSSFLKYILITGGLWRGVIEDCEITLKAPAKVLANFDDISPREHNARVEKDTVFLSWSFKNLKPDFDLELTKYGDRNPQDRHDPFLGNTDLPLTKEILDSFLYANKKELSVKRAEELRHHINRIYAYYGYRFQKPQLKDLYYYPGSSYRTGSPYREDTSFSEDKIPTNHKLFIKYLHDLEKWKLLIGEKKAKGLMPPDETKNPNFPVRDESPELHAVDHQRNVAFSVQSNYLLFLKYPEGIPYHYLKLPSYINTRDDFFATLSPNRKYLALSYCNIDLKQVILLIDTASPALLHQINVENGENRSAAQFDSSSSLLYTNKGAYNVVSGAKVKKWIFPAEYSNSNVQDLLEEMYSGRLKDGSLLFGSWVFNSLYRVDPNVGKYVKLMDFEAPGVFLTHGKISNDFSFLAGVVKKSRIVNSQQEIIQSDFVIWRILPDNSLQRIYSENLGRDSAIEEWSWLKGKSIFISKIHENNAYSFWRYDIEADKVSLNSIPIEGLSRYENKIKIDNNFISNRSLKVHGSQLWDIETGKKVLPLYEVFDPFDTSQKLPMYEPKPATVHIRNPWDD